MSSVIIQIVQNCMQIAPTTTDISESPQVLHRCPDCLENEAVLLKYKRLVDLLHKKVKHLQKKSRLYPHEANISQQSQLQHQHPLPQSLPQSPHSHICPFKELPDSPQATTRDSFRPTRRSLLHEWEASQAQKMEKVAVVINGLTEEVLQLKSNFMHVRQCVYAFVREANIGEAVRSNPTLLNMALALISIFEFSQDQREEMFSQRKVKHRRREKKGNKENVLVTIKEI